MTVWYVKASYPFYQLPSRVLRVVSALEFMLAPEYHEREGCRVDWGIDFKGDRSIKLWHSLYIVATRQYILFDG